MDIRIVIPPVWTGVFHTIGELFLSAFRSLDYESEMVEAELDAKARLNIIIGWNVFEPHIPKNTPYVICQYEQLRLDILQERFKSKEWLFKGALAVWEYSETNLPFLSGYPAYWLPLRYHSAIELQQEKSRPQWDVLIIGNMTPRRQKILRELSMHCCVYAEGHWKEGFETTLKRTKILLNIHQLDIPTPLEQARVSFALNNGCFVLTEDSIDSPYGSLPSASYDELVEVALHCLHYPAEREKARIKACNEFQNGPDMTETVAEAMSKLGLPFNKF
jgi:hypothetical protein